LKIADWKRLFSFHDLILVNAMDAGARSLFRHYATSRKVAGSIPDEVTGFYNLPNPSSCIMALN
jgi:hypothetical protein